VKAENETEAQYRGRLGVRAKEKIKSGEAHVMECVERRLLLPPFHRFTLTLRGWNRDGGIKVSAGNSGDRRCRAGSPSTGFTPVTVGQAWM